MSANSGGTNLGEVKNPEVVESNSIDDLNAKLDAAISAADTIRTNRMTEASDAYDSAVGKYSSIYNNRIKILDSDKSSSEQIAAINYAKLLKYLPEQLKNAGLGSLGTSSSVYLRANNSYMNRLADAKKVHRIGSMEADNEYQRGVASALSERYSAERDINTLYETQVNGLRNYYGGLIANEQQKIVNEQQILNDIDKNIVSEALVEFNNRNFETAEDVEAFIEGVKGKLNNPEYANVLYPLGETKKNDIKKLIEDMDKADKLLTSFKSADIYRSRDKDKDYVDDTVKLDIGNKNIKVDLGAEAPEIAEINSVKKIANNTAFIYNGNIYYKAPNGKVVTVETGKGYGKLGNYLMQRELDDSEKFGEYWEKYLGAGWNSPNQVADVLKNNIKKTSKETEEADDLLTSFKSADIYRSRDKDKDYVDDTVKLDIGNKNIKVDLGAEAPEIAEINSVKKIANNTAFIYNGNIYYKAPNGKIVTVETGKGYGKLENYLMQRELDDSVKFGEYWAKYSDNRIR